MLKYAFSFVISDSSVQENTTGKEDESLDSPTQDEFVSDTFNPDNLTEEDVRREMEQLGVNEDKKQGKNMCCISEEILLSFLLILSALTKRSKTMND